MRHRHWPARAWLLCLLLARPSSGRADPAGAGDPPAPVRQAPQETQSAGAPRGAEPADEDWSLHVQATTVTQGHGPFHAPYGGVNSLSSQHEHETSLTATLFLGRRLWPGAAVYADPEVAGGKGMSGTTGIAGFPNGEITRVAKPQPTPYLARLYLEQTFDLGGEPAKVEPEPNRLGGKQAGSRLTLRAGKLSATDLFDGNRYSHDPRMQFLNWSLMDNGAWDYPADTRGYTLGATAELADGDWAFRYGFFLMPREANGMKLDTAVADAHGQALELEHAHTLFGHPGKVRAMGYLNNADMGSYRETINTPAWNMDITRSRGHDRAKFGATIGLEQELSGDLGAFLRAGWNDGRTESFVFTEIDRTFQSGITWKGTSWGRGDDLAGLAFAVNGLSNDHKAYLARGGYGFIIGDGRLRYGPETILEVNYRIGIKDTLFITPDYQLVCNPAYNRDRGPVSVWAIRVHVEF